MARILRNGCGMEHILKQLIRLSTMDLTGATAENMVGFLKQSTYFLFVAEIPPNYEMLFEMGKPKRQILITRKLNCNKHSNKYVCLFYKGNSFLLQRLK